MPFHKVIEELFFKPLQMKNSFVFQLKDTLNIPPSHDYKGRHWSLNFQDGIVGDKNIYTTSHDLAKWHQALMHPDFINDSLRQAAFIPYSFEKSGVKNYGLGFRMLIDSENENSYKLIFHNGLWHGNNACFIHLPKQNIAIIAIGNKFSRVVYQAMTIANVFGDYLIGTPEIEETKIENSIQIDSVHKRLPDLKKIKDSIIKIKKPKDSIFIKLKDSVHKQPKIELDSVIELQKIELDSLNNVTI